MNNQSRRAIEPMCALDPLLLIPRIEYVEDVYEFVSSQPRDYCLVILDMKNFHIINDLYSYDVGDKVIEKFMAELRKRLPLGSVSLRFRHGDEFLFFIPEKVTQIELLFKTFCDLCETSPTWFIESGNITVSYRFAVIGLLAHEPVPNLLTRAERALRAVKGQGSPRY